MPVTDGVVLPSGVQATGVLHQIVIRCKQRYIRHLARWAICGRRTPFRQLGGRPLSRDGVIVPPGVVDSGRYRTAMSDWPAVSYDQWHETCDTLPRALPGAWQVGGEARATGATASHAALRLTARGWRRPPHHYQPPTVLGRWSLFSICTFTRPSSSTAAAASAEPLTPDRAVGVVTREVMAAVRRLGGAVDIDPAPQEVPWSVPLDEDSQHARYDQLVLPTTLRRPPRPLSYSMSFGRHLAADPRPSMHGGDRLISP